MATSSDIHAKKTYKFCQAKRAALDAVDLSKKGSVDEAIIDLIKCVNSKCQYFTTSSCSGRTIVVGSYLSETVNKKKGCRWLYVTHGQADTEPVLESVNKPSNDMPDTATFKFEPFIMHVQCIDIESARQMLQVAVACGYRNSGISLGKSGKIILAVRSTAGLEAPLIDKQRLLVTDQYIEFLVEKANMKMEDNISQISRLFKLLRSTEIGDSENNSAKEKAKRRDKPSIGHLELTNTENTLATVCGEEFTDSTDKSTDGGTDCQSDEQTDSQAFHYMFDVS